MTTQSPRVLDKGKQSDWLPLWMLLIQSSLQHTAYVYMCIYDVYNDMYLSAVYKNCK